MKKPLAILALLLSQSVFATATTYAKLDYFDPNWHQPKNVDRDFWSTHEYAVTNNTSSVEHINVCYKLITCPATHWQLVTNDCQDFDLPAAQTKHEKKSITLRTNYPFMGWCDVWAVTEVSGGESSSVIDSKQFAVG